MKQKFSVNLRRIIEKLNLEIIYYPNREILIENTEVNRPSLQIAGFFDFFDSSRIQILGKVENTYLFEMGAENRAKQLEDLFSKNIPAFVISKNMDIFPEIIACAQKYETPLLRTKKTACETMNEIIIYLSDELCPRVRRHGVLIEIYGEGVLVVGESGIGKTETAVELIKRGHRLVADDAVDLRRVSGATIMGSAPENLRNYVEIRGIGIIDIQRIFGVSAIKEREKVDMLVKLETWESGKAYERFGADTEYTEILGVPVPSITVPVRPGRNLAIIFELAALTNKQKRFGYNPAEELSKRLMESVSEDNGEN